MRRNVIEFNSECKSVNAMKNLNSVSHNRNDYKNMSMQMSSKSKNKKQAMMDSRNKLDWFLKNKHQEDLNLN